MFLKYWSLICNLIDRKIRHNLAIPDETGNSNASSSREKTTSKIISLKRKSETVIMTRSKKQKMMNEDGMHKTDEIQRSETKNSKSLQDIEKKTQPTKTIATLSFRIGEIVWCKVRGSWHWPAKVLSFDGRRYEVYWFNDYRRSKVFLSQLFKFEQNFRQFSVRFSSVVGLETAAKEALIYLSQA